MTDGGSVSRAYRAVPWWLWVAALAALVLVLLRVFVVQSFSVPSGSMEPTIDPGDRLLVSRLDRSDVRRGDVVVFDGTRAFGPDPVSGTTDYVKRVIGMPGDRVVCCAAAGRLTVNGVALDEPYLYPGDRPSDLTFDIVVPAGRLWVMGDHRSASTDSRAYLGRPGGGGVPMGDVIGQVWVRYWPPDRLGSLVDGAGPGVPTPDPTTSGASQ